MLLEIVYLIVAVLPLIINLGPNGIYQVKGWLVCWYILFVPGGWQQGLVDLLIDGG
jgi:hypothetical protein